MATLLYSLEDDQNIGYIINKTLTSAQYQVETFATAKAFLSAFNARKPDLVLLDLMLPDADGLAVLKRIKTTSRIPVIILSAKNYEVDKVIGLDSGADDYITKPFGALELISRVKVALRKVDDSKEETLHFENITMNINQRTCYVDQQEVILTTKEYELLKLLLENKGRVLERDVIFKTIWGYDFIGETRTLDMHINYLRKKLTNANSNLESMIKTIRGIGYMVVKDE